MTRHRGNAIPAMDLPDHEQVVIGHDPVSGLRAIVAIHSTALGPSLGGTRWLPYPTMEEALADALRLSEAMTLKNSLAGIPHGGGKGVIIGDPATDRTPDRLAAYGRLIASLGGRYVTAADMGTTVADMDEIGKVNPWTTGRSTSDGGAGDSGELTAYGVHRGLRAAAEHVLASSDLRGRRVAVSGVGKVGGRLIAYLVADGAEVIATDTDEAAVSRVATAFPTVTWVDPHEITEVEADVFAPCAAHGAITPEVAETIAVRLICGGANNQLSDSSLADVLAARSVVYVPDFAVNSGGVIQVAEELLGYNEASARRKVDEIATTVRRILATSVRDEITPLSAAQVLAAERIREAITPESAFRRFEAAPAAPVTLETAPPPSPWTG